MMKKLIVSILLLCALCVVTMAKRKRLVNIEPAYFKNVQGPPEEFALHYLPQPKSSALVSETDTFPITLVKQTNQKSESWEWQGTISIDSDQEAVINFITPLSKYTVQIAAPKETELAPEDFHPIEKLIPSAKKISSWFGLSVGDSIPMISYVIEKPKVGVYTIWVKSSEKPPKFKNSQKMFRSRASNLPRTSDNDDDDHASIVVMVYNKTPIQMFSHLSSDYHHLLVDRDVFMQTRLFKRNMVSVQNNNETNYGRIEDPDPIHGSITADIDLILPSGKEEIITMHDDGKNNDNAQGDGIYGASFVAQDEGAYVARITMQGINPSNGHVFSRSSDHVFMVIENDNLQFEDESSAIVSQNDEMITMQLHLTFDSNRTAEVIGQKYRAYAEVWATPASSSSQSEMVPVAFVTGMTVAQQGSFASSKKSSASTVMQLKLSAQWLSKAKATAPFQLRNLYVQESETNIPVATAARVNVPSDLIQFDDALEKLYAANFVTKKNTNSRDAFAQAVVNSLTETKFRFNGEISESMKFGLRPSKYAFNNRTRNEQGTIILVHGYCATLNPWQADNFENAAVFEDLKQSRSHDDFALLIREFADKYPAFSIAAHSQGGCASTHLKAFYWSNQDGTVSDADHRQVQSVGTPYKGNAFAGNLASIGKIFGVGCGVNNDLTRDGSSLWLSSVPKSAREAVYFYTTQYKEKSYCQFGSNLILSKPNDGVAETEWAILDGANNMGHSYEQCHSDGMKFQAQCRNPERNAEINKKAARGL